MVPTTEAFKSNGTTSSVKEQKRKLKPNSDYRLQYFSKSRMQNQQQQQKRFAHARVMPQSTGSQQSKSIPLQSEVVGKRY